LTFAPASAPIALTSAMATGSDQATRLASVNGPLNGDSGSSFFSSSPSSMPVPLTTMPIFSISGSGLVTDSTTASAAELTAAVERAIAPTIVSTQLPDSSSMGRPSPKSGRSTGASASVSYSRIDSATIAVPSPMQWWKRVTSALPPSTPSITCTCHSGCSGSSGLLQMSLSRSVSVRRSRGSGRATWCRCCAISKFGMSSQCGTGTGSPCSTTRWRNRGKACRRCS